MEIIKTFIVKEDDGILFKIYLLANGTYVKDETTQGGDLAEITKEEFNKYDYF